MKIVNYRLILLASVVFASCQIDNYPEPDAVFIGKIVDVQTGKTIQTRQPDGIQIRLIQEGYENPVPYDFWAKNDGTFRNTRLFGGNYKVTVQAGPFHNSVTKTVMLKSGSETDETFEVEPYVRITDVNISVSGTTITGSYKLSMGDGTTQIKHSKLICHVSPILHKNTDNLGSSEKNDLTGVSASELESMLFTDEITGLKAGTYYVRVAVESKNSLGRNNYSEIVKAEL
ncbi:MAG: DUF3823 domain-containing protein [Cytophagales bacterium]|nr:DUF3823 domain-containing protein [Cytophagales bacterium]